MGFLAYVITGVVMWFALPIVKGTSYSLYPVAGVALLAALWRRHRRAELVGVAGFAVGAVVFRELSVALSEKQRMVFVLYEIEGLSSAEVAKVIDSRESTVRNHLFNARRILRQEVLRRFPEYAEGFGLARKREDE